MRHFKHVYVQDMFGCQNIVFDYWRISQISQCIQQISLNAPFCNRDVLISVKKWCIMGDGTGALWDLCNSLVGYRSFR